MKALSELIYTDTPSVAPIILLLVSVPLIFTENQNYRYYILCHDLWSELNFPDTSVSRRVETAFIIHRPFVFVFVSLI